MSVLTFYFGWPDGAVWGNLLASAICAAIVWWRLRARIVAHHVEVLVQAERQHRDMKAHVAAAVAERPAPEQVIHVQADTKPSDAQIKQIAEAVKKNLAEQAKRNWRTPPKGPGP